MHLEKIELTGFKSFADKTVIEFDKGVTAVVGPNGSGKSNLSEAVRWVLGEQSAKNLRGKKMDDIVFAGSQSRKPVNIAEVTLLLNNEDHYLPLDFSQVSITRRMNRNGESNCFINKKPCRLKDITDLLMDSGIGKDSFSMISQGKVEQIFQNKPEERRSIFEDAAGISKYKNRKVLAERKLGSTVEHLNRVEDILHEISNQLIPLEVQRNTALLYQKKKKELSHIEIALIAVEIETVNEQWQLSKKELVQYQNQVEHWESLQSEVQKELGEIKEESLHINEELDVLQEKNIHIIQQAEQLEAQKHIVEQKVEFSAKNKKQQEDVLQRKYLLIEEQQSALDTLLNNIKGKTSQKKELQIHIEALEQQQQDLSQDQNKWILDLRENYIEKLQLQSTNKNTLMHVERERERTVERINVLQKKNSVTEKDIAEYKVALETKEVHIKEEEMAIQSLKNELDDQREKMVQLEKQDHFFTQEMMTVSRNLQQAEARKESQQELEESYASYYQGVKEILKRKDAISGIHGPVGELFHVPEEYLLAMDTALGSAIQHIVVSDSDSASKCISILKTNHLGRATFLPLTVIKGKTMPAQIVREIERLPGFVGMGSSLITYQESYKDIAANLLGTTIISKDLQSGISIAKAVHNRYRVVSLEGDVIHAGGSMTGGATKKQQSASVFSRKNTIEKLTTFIDQQVVTYQSWKKKVDSMRHFIQEHRKNREELQQRLNEKYLHQQKANDLRERNLNQLVALQEENELTQYEEKMLSKSLVELEQQLVQEKKLKLSLAEEIERIKQDMQNSTLNEEERVALLQSNQRQLQESQQKLAVLLEQEKQIRRDIQNCKLVIETEQQSIKVLQAELKENRENEKLEHHTIEEVKKNLNVQHQKKSEVDEFLKTKRKKKKELESLVAAHEKQLQEITHSLKKTWMEVAKRESSSGRYEVAIDHYLNRLSEEYGLNFESAQKEYRLALTTEEASDEVQLLKKEIESLGIINLASIEEFERISERYDFLINQQNDLLTAKTILLRTMKEMDEEVSTRFEKTFKEIKKQFEVTFPKLFGGGKATIELTDPTNLLETGIEIIAQPPGKSLQHLNLLSGGEKAFTAIALLFSIIEVSSVPFCILDEVEAALDEANVSRFGRYLTSFESKTQFIIITHRKGTMEEANVLYGVTMQDSGVSRLASVKFQDQDRA